jgi:hypothetical protein
MPKTRRTKINAKRSLRTSPNIILLKAGGDQINPRDGKPPIFVHKLTGMNTGRNYPYASTKRGGRAVPDLRLSPRQITAVIDGA